MKPNNICFVLFLFFTSLSVSAQVEVKIPDKCVTILVPDSASYVAFLTEKKNPPKDNQFRLKVASLKDGRGLWSRKVFPRHRLIPCNGGLIYEDTYEYVLLDYETGSSRKIEGTPLLVDDKAGIIISAKGVDKKKLTAYSMKDLRPIWDAQINYKNNIPMVHYYQPDSSYVIASGSILTKIDMSNGPLKTVPIKEIFLNNNKFDLTAFDLSNIFFGPLGAFVYLVLEGTEVSKGYGANVLTNDSCIFVSDRETLRCFDMNLNEKWKSLLPRNVSSLARMIVEGDTLRMINFGFVACKPYRYRVGQPFMAEFNIKTGEYYSLRFFPKKFDKKRFGDYLSFLSVDFFVCEDGKYSLVSLPADCACIYTPDHKVLFLDEELNVKAEFNEDKIYFVDATLPDGSRYLRSNRGKNCVFVKIDADGNEVEKLPDTVKRVIMTSRGLIVQYDTFFKIFKREKLARENSTNELISGKK